MGRYTKAIIAALVAGGTAYLAAQADGVITGEEIGYIVAATLTALGFTWAVPNSKPVEVDRAHRM